MSIANPGPLSYTGERAVPFTVHSFPPSSNYDAFPVPTLWIDTTTNAAWILVDKAAGFATWISLGNAANDLQNLTGNTGGPVPANSLYNINLIGDIVNGIVVSGNPATNTLTFTQTGTFAQQHIIYVGKHGNNANLGTNINTAVLTFGQALILAAAATPTVVNRYAIVCFDDGIYTEDITCVEYVDIYAANAALTGTIAAVGNSSVKLRAQNVAAGTIGVLKAVGAAYSDIDIDEIIVSGNGIGFVCLSGLMNCIWKRMYIDSGFGIGDITSGLAHMHLKGGDIYVSGAGIAIARANTGSTIGHVDHILQIGAAAGTAILCLDGNIDLDINLVNNLLNGIVVSAGTCNLIVNEINCTTAYNVSNGATLQLIAQTLTGTETYGATANIVIQYAANSIAVFECDTFLHRRTRAAQEVRLHVQNPDNTNANSYAFIECSAGGPVAGDPGISVNVVGGNAWVFGIDNSSDDNLYIGSSPSTPSLSGPAVTITTGATVGTYGNVTFPQTAAFEAYLSASVLNATGNNTIVTVVCDTEVFDQNGNYNNGTGVFTAPQTGRYAFYWNVNFAAIGAAHDGWAALLGTTARTYFLATGNPAVMKELTPAGDAYQTSGSLLVSMAAGDTAHFAVTVLGGAQTVTIAGKDAGPEIRTYFAGNLQC